LSNVLTPFPPFRPDLTVWALRRRTRNAIDRWDDTIYRRVIDVGGRPTELEEDSTAATACTN
jgi:DNA-3-methyladenine glycosylase II